MMRYTTHMMIEHGNTISDHIVTEHREAINHAEDITLLGTLAMHGTEPTHADVLQLHGLVTATLLPSAE